VSTRVRVGDVEVRVEADLTHRQLKQLLRTCAGIALGLREAEGEPERQPFGFNAHVERAPEPAPENFYTDDEPE
jgi:hypothetical protein